MTATISQNTTMAQYDLAFQVSPIILNGGIAANAQGGLLPIISIMPGLQQGGQANWPRFLTLPGSTLINNQVATYPFANQVTAANAIIPQPLTVSLLMIAPVNSVGGYTQKLSMFTGMQNALYLHNNNGGSYFIATPAFVYGPVLLTGISDVTDNGQNNPQVQIKWQWDFVQPILTSQSADLAQNNITTAMTAGTQLPTQPTINSANQATYNPTLSGVLAALSTFTQGNTVLPQ